MPYTFLYFNKLPEETEIREKNFESVDHLVDEINMRLNVAGGQFQPADYQTPIKLSEIKLCDVDSIGYSFPHLIKPRLLYLPRSSYKVALKKGTLYHTTLQMTIVGQGPLDLSKAQQGMLYEEIKAELNSFSTPCFLVIGDDNEHIEAFKERWAIATDQHYYWQDIIKAFFLGIFASLSDFFVGQEQKNEVPDDMELEFPQVPVHVNDNPQAIPSMTSCVASSPILQSGHHFTKHQQDNKPLDELLDGEVENVENNDGIHKKTSWCNIL